MNEYKKVRLGDVCEKGSSNIAQNEILENEGNYPIYGAAGFIKNVDFYKQEEPYIGIVKDGAGVGRVSVHPAKSSLIGTMQYIFPKENIEIGYLAAYLKSQNLGSLYKGAAIPHIYFKDYENFQIPLPPKETQKQIASSLDKVTKIITENKTLLEKYDLLIKSRFIEMFGDPVINEKDWDLKTLPELGEFGRGVSKHRPRNAPELLGGKYPLIQTGDVANANLYITNYESTYSEEGFKQSKMWKAGTLCITIAATIAKTAILTFDSCFPDSVVGFTPNEKTNSLFINYWFSFFQKILEEQAPAVAQKNINLQVLSELKIITPPISLQNDFAAFVQQIDKSKFVVQKSLEKAETLYKSLMQEYFG